MAKLRVGDSAPDFELEGTGSADYRLADYRSSGVILAFYPGDFTPVCTKQFCSYRDDGERIEALGMPMVGISPQSVDSHERFADRARADGAAARPTRARRSRASTASSGPAGSCGGRSSSSIGRASVRYRNVALLRPSLPGRRRPASGPSRSSPSRCRRAPQPSPFEVGPRGRARAARRWGRGRRRPLHGLTATRRYVLHGSRRAGARRLPAGLLRRPRARRVGSGAGGGGLWIPGARRRPGAVLGRAGGRRAARAGRALDGLPHRGRLRARPRRRGGGASSLAGPVVARHPGRRRVAGLLGRPRGRRWSEAGSTASWRHTRRPWRPIPPGRETALRITRERMARHRHPGGARPGAAGGAALASLRGARGAGDARRPGAGRRQLRRGRPRPPLRDRRGLGRAAARRHGWSARSPASRRSPGRAAASRARSRTSWTSRPSASGSPRPDGPRGG